MVRNGQSYFYHFDGLGSVTAITDSTGSAVQKYEYDSFGNIVSMLDPNFKQPYTYTSREYDEETGLYYYRARYYDSAIGRFISEDPIGLLGGVNFYSYAGNSPVNWIDPLGLRIEWGYVITNPLVRSNLERLNQTIINFDYSNNDFVLRITGGDRYRDKDGHIRSLTDDSIVCDSSQTSPHLIERGARAVDLQVIGISNELFDRALRMTDFSSANTRRNYKDGHTHINLPNIRKFYIMPSK
jgi:RHS repeat-associated protein